MGFVSVLPVFFPSIVEAMWKTELDHKLVQSRAKPKLITPSMDHASCLTCTLYICNVLPLQQHIILVAWLMLKCWRAHTHVQVPGTIGMVGQSFRQQKQWTNPTKQKQHAVDDPNKQTQQNVGTNASWNCQGHHLHTKGSKVQTWFCSGLQSNGRRNLLKTSARPTARRTSWEVNYWSAAVGGLGTLLLQQNKKFHESVVVRRCSKCSNKHKTCKKKLISVRTLRLTISHHPIIQLGTFVEHYQTCVEWRRRRTRAKHQVQQYGSCIIYATTWLWTTCRMTS